MHSKARLAIGIAVLADGLQIGLSWFFAEGFASPANDILDVVMAGVLTVLTGWHLAFIPTFLVELLPFGDLAPTWTLAAIIATRSQPASPTHPQPHEP